MSEVVTASSADLVPVEATNAVEAPRRGRLARTDRGMVSAEWAVGIIAAIAIAGVLLAVVTNGAVQDALLKFILYVINSFADMMTKR